MNIAYIDNTAMMAQLYLETQLERFRVCDTPGITNTHNVILRALVRMNTER